MGTSTYRTGFRQMELFGVFGVFGVNICSIACQEKIVLLEELVRGWRMGGIRIDNCNISS